MARDILIHSGIAEISIAVLDDGALARFWCETTLGATPLGGARRAGDIVLGRVKSVNSSLDAAFVDIGDGRDGFLGVRDATKGAARPGAGSAIADLVREGEAIVVQVLREAQDRKGARLGVNIAIPGRLLVFSPEGSRAAVSRRVAGNAERERLTAILEKLMAKDAFSGACLVARTAAAGASPADIAADAGALAGMWAGIAAARDGAVPPAVLHRESGPIERALRDAAGSAERVVIDDVQAMASAQAYASRAGGGLAARLEHYRKIAPLFEHFGIAGEIDALAAPRVALPSGGWITVEHTEAMTAIDVNSGAHGGEAHLAATALAVDLEAAETIARQIVLRDIGGLIVADFISVASLDDFARIVEALDAALKSGNALAEIAAVPEQCLAVITRKQTRRGPHRHGGASHGERCPECEGRGRIGPIAEAGHAALRLVERCAASAPGKPIAMRVGSELAAWLEGYSDVLRPALARRGVANLRVFPETARARGDFAVETIAPEGLP